MAQFPLPVITGIGHDKDDTVIDMVAHTRMKTPTAVAEFLITGALQFSQQLGELEKQFMDLVTHQLEDHKNRLSDAADQLNLLVNQLIGKQTNRLNIARLQLSNSVDAFLKSQFSELKGLTVETKNKVSRFVTLQSHLLDQSGRQIGYIFRKQVMRKQNSLTQYHHLVRIRAQETIRAEKKSMGSIQDKLRLVDPLNILKRGYSLTLMDGKIVKSVEQVKNGDVLETKLRDGKVISIVDQKEQINN